MKRFLLFSLLMIAITCYGQVQTTVLELTDANVWINSNGVLFNNFATAQGGYEAPANTGNSAIFNASLWLGGADMDGNLHMTGITHCQENTDGFCEYFPGPLTADGTASTTNESFLEYNRFWFISRDQVELQELYFNCVNDPDCNAEAEFPGYSIPLEILEWPAHGDTISGFSYHLAPFVDVDGDGSYDPTNGDYPSFTGDKAVYMIWNDKGGEHLNSGGEAFGVEVHTMIYYFLDTNPALSRTTYVHQDIFNRSLTDYENVYLGVWNDFDLGNLFDDFVGTNVENSFVFVHNDGFDDESIEGPGYGFNLPRMACKILAGPYMDANGEDDAGPFNGNEEYGDFTKGWNDGVIDNERLGLSGSSYSYGYSQPTGPPENAVQFFASLRNIWNNGTPLSFGGTGYTPTQNLLAANYVFPGDSDPYNMGTEGVDPNYPYPGGWTPENEGLGGAERTINANCGPFTFLAGQKQSIDYVYVFAIQSDDPGADMDDMLTDYVNIAAARPDELPTGVVTSVKRVEKDEVGFTLYPNPAKSKITLAIAENVPANYRIYNILGTEMSSGKVESGQTTIDISRLNSGIYLVNVQAGEVCGTRKLVVE